MIYIAEQFKGFINNDSETTPNLHPPLKQINPDQKVAIDINAFEQILQN